MATVPNVDRVRTGGTLPEPTSHPPPLLRLPEEIRTRVYELLFQDFTLKMANRQWPEPKPDQPITNFVCSARTPLPPREVLVWFPTETLRLPPLDDDHPQSWAVPDEILGSGPDTPKCHVGMALQLVNHQIRQEVRSLLLRHPPPFADERAADGFLQRSGAKEHLRHVSLLDCSFMYSYVDLIHFQNLPRLQKITVHVLPEACRPPISEFVRSIQPAAVTYLARLRRENRSPANLLTLFNFPSPEYVFLAPEREGSDPPPLPVLRSGLRNAFLREMRQLIEEYANHEFGDEMVENCPCDEVVEVL